MQGKLNTERIMGQESWGVSLKLHVSCGIAAAKMSTVRPDPVAR
jgi:hypothetical protein